MPKSDNKSPGFWFFTRDYERDMQILSLASQGLWSRMLCWMHDNEAHRGFMELPTGEPMEARDVAAKVGKSEREIERCMQEMERVGVFSRDDRGCVYCRRMARDWHISSVRAAAAKSRAESAHRAFDGSFAGAKSPANASKIPTVSDSVSDSVSVPTSPPNPRGENVHQIRGDDAFEELYSRHPNKRNRGLAQTLLAQSVESGADLAEIDRVHRQYCEMEWAQIDQRFIKRDVPPLAQWLLDKGWKYPPKARDPTVIPKSAKDAVWDRV